MDKVAEHDFQSFVLCLVGLLLCEQFLCYIFHLPLFLLYTNHKPLVFLIITQDLDKAPLRCHRMLMRLRGYNLNAIKDLSDQGRQSKGVRHSRRNEWFLRCS